MPARVTKEDIDGRVLDRAEDALEALADRAHQAGQVDVAQSLTEAVSWVQMAQLALVEARGHAPPRAKPANFPCELCGRIWLLADDLLEHFESTHLRHALLQHPRASRLQERLEDACKGLKAAFWLGEVDEFLRLLTEAEHGNKQNKRHKQKKQTKQKETKETGGAR